MRRIPLVIGCTIALVAPTGAWAAGGPVTAMQGGPGVAVPGGDVSFVAVGVGGRTLVEQVRHGGRGGIGRTRLLPGRWGVPGAAYDGSTTGLAADGRTLVLAEPVARFPVRRTRLAVLDARRLRVVRRVTMPGFYTVDAIAPSGRWLYLIHYLTQDAARYEVRAYDLVRHRLAPQPVVDVREPDEKMQGLPLARATSADGRWAYTLYFRPDGAPFIHALDTERRAAACIDLPALRGNDISALRLTPPRGTGPLLVQARGAAPLAVDVGARTAAPVRPSPRPAAPQPRRDAEPDLLPWLLALAAAAGVGGAALLGARRRRRPPRSAPV
jgi:hypothetical protein